MKLLPLSLRLFWSYGQSAFVIFGMLLRMSSFVGGTHIDTAYKAKFIIKRGEELLSQTNVFTSTLETLSEKEET